MHARTENHTTSTHLQVVSVAIAGAEAENVVPLHMIMYSMCKAHFKVYSGGHNGGIS